MEQQSIQTPATCRPVTTQGSRTRRGRSGAERAFGSGNDEGPRKRTEQHRLPDEDRGTTAYLERARLIGQPTVRNRVTLDAQRARHSGAPNRSVDCRFTYDAAFSNTRDVAHR
jgi:hypothetical protein